MLKFAFLILSVFLIVGGVTACKSSGTAPGAGVTPPGGGGGGGGGGQPDPAVTGTTFFPRIGD